MNRCTWQRFDNSGGNEEKESDDLHLERTIATIRQITVEAWKVCKYKTAKKTVGMKMREKVNNAWSGRFWESNKTFYVVYIHEQFEAYDGILIMRNDGVGRSCSRNSRRARGVEEDIRQATSVFQ